MDVSEKFTVFIYCSCVCVSISLKNNGFSPKKILWREICLADAVTAKPQHVNSAHAGTPTHGCSCKYPKGSRMMKHQEFKKRAAFFTPRPQNHRTLFAVAAMLSFAGSSAYAAQCLPGTFSSNGQDTPTPCTQATPGYFVPGSGATSPFVARPGHYVSTFGATSQTQATPGHYVSDTGATSQLSTQPGYYVSTFGASSRTACPTLSESYVASPACRALSESVLGQAGIVSAGYANSLGIGSFDLGALSQSNVPTQ